MVLVKQDTWQEFQALRGTPGLGDPVFRSRKSGYLTPSQVWRNIKAAAARAGLPPDVSTHWLRHAHVSHALDRGAPVSLVQNTLGHASVATMGGQQRPLPAGMTA